ncbi:MAG: ornithine carbamoyltransferase [Phycisphaerae bacterium]
MPKLDFVSIVATSQERLEHIMAVARRLKAQLKTTGRNDPIAAGKTLAMIFEKPSLRTRVSFEVAMVQMGGAGLYIAPSEIGLGKRESVADVARVLSGMVDGIMARVFEHDKLLGLAKYATIPVVNGLSDYSHPCQAMADLLTMEEHFGKLQGLTLAYVGDGNNVARSLMCACARFGVKFRIASPAGYELENELVDRIMKQEPTLDFGRTSDPILAVQEADAIYTDTWVSMGQEEEKAARLPIFQPYQINAQLLDHAPRTAIVMHCLPAYRGVEITDEVIDGPQSVVFQQAENRLHFQKGLLAVVLAGQ